jgi:limonene-1,2-epoxide hydrolase
MTDDDKKIERRKLLAAGATGALLAMVAKGREAAAAELSESEAANVKLVTAFCAAWSSRNLANVTALMSDDAVYRMSQTTPPVTGHAGLVGQMQPWVDSSDTIEFKILETMAKGPIVINHRIDHFASKTRPVKWEGVGVFYVENGKIKEWSDYTIRVERS